MRMLVRPLTRAEIEQIWTIDRSEVIANVYYLEDGELRLRPDYFDARGWPPGQVEKYTPILYECFDRGGSFQGVFDGSQLIGVTVVDTKPLGPRHGLRQLKFRYVSKDYRKQGWGKVLFESAKTIARERGARGLYISATPSENTINFYQSLGCIVTLEPDRDLVALEPEDIHLECIV